MKAFEEWNGYVESEGRKWPCFGRFGTKKEYEAAKEVWKEALNWIRVKVENYTPDDVLYFIDNELEN